MACPCCVQQQSCFCSDPRTQNCTVTASISVPDKNYSVSRTLSCNSPIDFAEGYGSARFAQNIPMLDPGIQFFGSDFISGNFFSVGGAWSFIMYDCPIGLRSVPDAQFFIRYADQGGCEADQDSGDLPQASFHFFIQLRNRNNVAQFFWNSYAYCYRVDVNPTTSEVTASIVWQGYNWIGSQICGDAAGNRFGPFTRCLPCYFNNRSFCGVQNNDFGAGHCPADITGVAPTLTIACPP